MAAFSVFYPFITSELPSAPEFTIDAHIRQTVIDFCTRTLVHVERLPDITLVADTSTYTLTPPAGTAVVSVIEAWTDSRRLEPMSAANVDGNWRADKGAVTAFFSEAPGDVTLYRIPQTTDAGTKVYIRAALSPSLTATTVDDSLQAYITGIADGVKASLMQHPNQPWTNQQLSLRYAQSYEKAVNDARISLRRGFNNARLTMKMRAF